MNGFFTVKIRRQLYLFDNFAYNSCLHNIILVIIKLRKARKQLNSIGTLQKENILILDCKQYFRTNQCSYFGKGRTASLIYL